MFKWRLSSISRHLLSGLHSMHHTVYAAPHTHHISHTYLIHYTMPQTHTTYTHLIHHTAHTHCIYHIAYIHLIHHTTYIHLIHHTTYSDLIHHTRYTHLSHHIYNLSLHTTYTHLIPHIHTSYTTPHIHTSHTTHTPSPTLHHTTLAPHPVAFVAKWFSAQQRLCALLPPDLQMLCSTSVSDPCLELTRMPSHAGPQQAALLPLSGPFFCLWGWCSPNKL